MLSNGWGQNCSSVATDKFNFVLSADDISWQIASLLNQNNRLTKRHSVGTIKASPIKYFVDLAGQKVTGCIGLLHEQNIDKLLHLSVDTSYRGLGIAKKLMSTALTNSKRDVLYMTVREDNAPCLRLAHNFGFVVTASEPKTTYNILSLCLFRRK